MNIAKDKGSGRSGGGVGSGLSFSLEFTMRKKKRRYSREFKGSLAQGLHAVTMPEGIAHMVIGAASRTVHRHHTGPSSMTHKRNDDN